MILKAERVAELLRNTPDKADDPFVITPQPKLDSPEHGGSAGVDLRLGTWFVNLVPARITHLKVSEDTSEYQLTKTHYVPFGREYLLHPGGFVLGVTLEWLRLPSNLAAYVIGKSSWGRRGLIIATATGVHPGFKGCLTLELSNVGEIAVAIRPGMTICQLFFHWVDGSGTDNIDRSRFVGLRKPTLGSISMDDVARRLANAYHGAGASVPAGLNTDPSIAAPPNSAEK
jgi:dCTP deaminase